MRLWNHALKNITAKNIALQGMEAIKDKYLKIGFIPSFKIYRNLFNGTDQPYST